MCRTDSGLRALRDTNDLANSIGLDTSIGWPTWWRPDIVLGYSPTLDGISIVDAVVTDLPPFRLPPAQQESSNWQSQKFFSELHSRR